MSEYAPRCPFCANVLKLEPSFWERIGLKASKTHCPTCHRTCEAQDANTMGSAYGHWAEVFRKELTECVTALPVLEEVDVFRVLGNPMRDETRIFSSIDDLVRTCSRHHRTVIVEMARGREATLDVVFMNDAAGGPEAVAILGVSAPESGSREQQQLIARSAPNAYTLFSYPAAAGAEQRVREAIHQKPARTLTEAHVAAMRAEPHATHHYR
jgi:hypothetical protein